MASHAHRNQPRWIVKREDGMFPVIRCHKNALHLWIIRNSPEANSSWGIAHFGQPPGFWFKRPDSFGCCAEEAVFVRTGDSAKRVGSRQAAPAQFSELSSCLDRVPLQLV
jgi:hypothetical protein